MTNCRFSRWALEHATWLTAEFLGWVENVFIKDCQTAQRPYVYYNICLQRYLKTHLVELKWLLEVNEQENNRLIIMGSFPITGRGPDLSAVIF